MTAVAEGDGLTYMQGLAEGSVDAIVTDPPYCSGAVGEAARTAAKSQGLREGVGNKKLGWFVGDNMGTAGIAYLLRAVAWEAARVLKPSGSLLIFCDWRMVPNLAPAVESAGLRYQNLLVWDKKVMGLGSGFRHQHEMILHFTNGAPEYHNKGTSNVISVKRVNSGERVHQTQKPVELMRALIEVVCPIGGLVLDPFAGSGSTGVASLSIKRRFIGVERDPSNVQTANERLRGIGPVITAKANGASYEQLIAAGWTDALLVEHGMMAA